MNVPRTPLFVLGAVLTLCITPLFGALSLSLDEMWSGDLSQIFWSVRLPRVGMAFLVGGLLAMCGAVYQAIFRNPLASPYTLGVSSGAALGCSIGIVVGGLHLMHAAVFGIVGSVLTIVLVYWLSRSLKGDVGTRLLLSGVVLSFFLSSMILFVQYLGDFTQIFRISRWLMGSVETVGYDALIVMSVVSVIVTALLVMMSEELTVLSFGSEFALTKGVDVRRLIQKLFFLTSFVIGITVSFCGPIGFVGIAVPYIVRTLGAYHYRRVILDCYLLGGIVLTICDTVGRTIIAPAEIPVGVITALIAAPLVMFLLMREPVRTT